MGASENRTDFGAGPNWPVGARLPIPGNAEWLWLVIMILIVGLIALISDLVDAPAWVDFIKWTTSAYLISRGIAKASRVLEQ